MKRNFLFLSFLLFSISSFGQNEKIMSIQKAWSKVLNAESKEEKIRLHNSVLGQVGNYAHTPGNKGDLSQLKNFKDIWSKDSSLRVISWFYQLDENEFDLHAHIAYDGNNFIEERVRYVHHAGLKKTDFKVRRDTTYSTENWPAAWYYKIVEKENRFGKKYFTLIGWIPKNRISQQKIVDILWFDKEEMYFGAPLFEREGKREHRLLYEYSAQNTMRLSYQEDKDQLIMDHLSPPGAEYFGIYEYYGPDFSFDAFRWENDRWLYYPDVDVDEGLNKKKSDFKKDDKILEEKPVYKSE